MPFYEAAFYGQKIDVQIWSAIGREFSLATNQVDFSQPENFGLVFTNDKGEEERPLIIHRAPLGSHERFVGFLIEHFAGNFPVWLAPVQAVIIPITDRHVPYAQQIAASYKAAGIRIKVDDSDERMNKKIRQAQMQKVPYMFIVGDQEAESGTIPVRTRLNENRGALYADTFKAELLDLIREKSLAI